MKQEISRRVLAGMKEVFTLLVFTLFLFSSCRKFVEIAPSPNLINTADIFESDKTALSAVSGVYVQMRAVTTHFTNGGMSMFGGLLADELYNTASSTQYDPFYTNSLVSTFSTINGSFYSLAYKNIYTINSILDGLSHSVSLTDSVRKQLQGEMKTVRAFFYFYLVNLFGDVPLVLGTDYRENAIMPRTAVLLVYDQVINDLKDAEALMKPVYPSAGKVRPNRYTASALLARVYLYRNDWGNAEMKTSEVINGGYNLVTNLNNVFLINSNETIWELATGNDAGNNSQATTYIPASATVRPTLAVTDYLLNAFEAGDQRKGNWLKSNTIVPIVYYYPYKYKVKASTPVGEYNVVLRLAEQYLIRAETRAMQNNLAGAQADLNIIRARAGLAGTTANTQAGLLAAIAKERQTELFTEWGDRWLDLKRTNTINAILSIVKGSNWQSMDALFPIPYNELQYNVYLVQNPGY